ncbi:MAG TPA: DUF1572 family protein [Pirellulales bacterium]|nr:DUF1572 family protein [Pirellulales bacterium]
MPIEAQSPEQAAASSIGPAFLAEARQTLAGSLTKIVHCLEQLPEADLSWRQHESHNSLQNIMLHLCGNVRQWLVHGVGGESDVRHRLSEFSDRQPLAKAELLARLQETLAQADRARWPASRRNVSSKRDAFKVLTRRCWRPSSTR